MDGQTTLEEATTGSTTSAWPGERQPTKYDVDEGTKIPESTFIDGFALALLHSEGPDGGDVSWMEDEQADENSFPAQTYTYPLVALLDVPSLPAEDELARLSLAFGDTFRKHIFVEKLNRSLVVSPSSPPYLQLALACLTATCKSRSEASGSTASIADDTFRCGLGLWIVMLEVDNRLSRTSDAIISGVLFCTYGALSAEKAHWRKARGVLCNVATISRRLHLTDGPSASFAIGPARKAFDQDSILISYMLVVDVVQAIHCDSVPNYSPQELSIQMPGSHHAFRKVYGSLFGGFALPLDVVAREDALLLLIALLVDIIRAQKTASLPLPVQTDFVAKNPFAPTGIVAETEHTMAKLESALARWHNHFPHVTQDIFALYHFAELQVCWPTISKFLRFAGYPNRDGARFKSVLCTAAPQQAEDHAWKILDHSEGCAEDSEAYMSIWLPVIVFVAALLVLKASDTKKGHNRSRIMKMFTSELTRLQWPCCTAMIATIENLANVRN